MTDRCKNIDLGQNFVLAGKLGSESFTRLARGRER